MKITAVLLLLAVAACVSAYGLYQDERPLKNRAEEIFDKVMREHTESERAVETDCGTCGVGYEACCVGYYVAGYPCNCFLGFNKPFGYDCGDCGDAYDACCLTSKIFGTPCACPIGPM